MKAQQQLPDLRLARLAPRFLARGGPRRWQRVFPMAKAAAAIWMAGFAAATLAIGDHQPANDVLDDIVGLAAMKERVEMAGGAWSLRSEAGSGTTIEAVFPRDTR